MINTKEKRVVSQAKKCSLDKIHPDVAIGLLGLHEFKRLDISQLHHAKCAAGHCRCKK